MQASREFHDHTADILYTAKAATLKKLFEQCALALEESMVTLSGIEAKQEVTITGENKSIEYLLFDFLDDLLYYKDAEQLIFSEFKISIEKKEDVFHLTCIAKGDQFNPELHDQHVDVKAITMHQFYVKEIEGGFAAQVIIDI